MMNARFPMGKHFFVRLANAEIRHVIGSMRHM